MKYGRYMDQIGYGEFRVSYVEFREMDQSARDDTSSLRDKPGFLSARRFRAGYK